MPRLTFTRRAVVRLDEIFVFLNAQDGDVAEAAIATIVRTADILELHPFAGRQAHDLEPNFRELVVPFGVSGYVILYTVIGDQVVILSIRHQKEVGYDGDPS